MSQQDAEIVAQINTLYVRLSPYGRLITLRVVNSLFEQYQYLDSLMKNKPPIPIPAMWHYAKGE